MTSKLLTLILLYLLMGACSTNSTPTVDIINEQFPEAQKEIQELVTTIFQEAKEKDFEAMESRHLYGPKFTKFDTDPLEKMDAATTKETEVALFSQLAGFDFKISEFQADVFGETAVASFYITFDMVMGEDTFSGKARSTLVFVKTGEGWKITHEHFSSF